MFAGGIRVVGKPCDVTLELIVIRFKLIDGGGLPCVGFLDVSVIDGSQAYGSLVFRRLREEVGDDADGGCLKHYGHDRLESRALVSVYAQRADIWIRVEGFDSVVERVVVRGCEVAHGVDRV